MHITLTHEQADFDALASLLGCWLLNEEIIPILPKKMNRNCIAFHSLYGSDLPFIEQKKIPQGEIKQITLVDTQSHISLKGITKKTEFEIIDHHSLRPELPKHWKASYQELGACTTIFVEHLLEIKKPLTPLQATLLLLGIYEDTGTLTYNTTTSRDMRAAAFLLEEGASLKITMDYLNPPLTNGQREVYNSLIENLENHGVNGQKIIITKAEAEKLSEEISSIAHKLRDLFDPDALFVLVTTSEGVRLVARSSTDRIDVSTIAAYFGGGGHSKASAALIHPYDDLSKKESMDKVHQELIDILPEFIAPPITVGQIMSRHPLIIPPEMSAKEASHLMQRYGYEGYPVVKNGKVLGLLTRRAVDKALGHKLNINVESLMEASEVNILPGDSLESLQRLMIQSGWGQIPVISPEDGEIIGIVTRTDLLKVQSGKNTLVSGRRNLAGMLENVLLKERFVLLRAISETAHDLRLASYIVGGFVRDLLLNRPGVDFDIVIEGDAILLAKSLSDQIGGSVVTHRRFGTAKWQIKDKRKEILKKLGDFPNLAPINLPESLDLISARTEFYDYPTALPTIESGSIKLDLHRRDFTINTLALRLDGRHFGELYDYYGGLHDLEKGLIRVLHSLSFVDDPTRMLRAVRFEKRFNFSIEPRTLQLMGEAGSLLRQLTGYRIRHEFDLIFEEKQASKMLNRLQNLGLLECIHPDLKWNNDLDLPLQRVLHEPIKELWKLPSSFAHFPIRRAIAYIMWLISTPNNSIEIISEKLRIPIAIKNAASACKKLIIEANFLENLSVSQIVERFEILPRPALLALYFLRVSPTVNPKIDQYLEDWQHIQIITGGNDLLKMGIPPGPIYKSFLTTLRAARLDGKVINNQDEVALREKLFRDISSIYK